MRRICLILLFCLPFLRLPAVAEPEEMITIPAGPFRMGRGSTAPFGPERDVTLAAFRIDRTEVTYGAYRSCIEAGACKQLPNDLSPMFFRDELPMVWVSWLEAQNYCRWAGKRLPTEAEWEKAARGSAGYRYPWGDEYIVNQANLIDVVQAPVDLHTYRFSWPVGAAPGDVSPYGVRDLAGNVAEWTADVYRHDYHAATSAQNPHVVPESDPQGFGHITVRGGSFVHDRESATTFHRDGQRVAASRGLRLGFRCAGDAQ